MAVSDITTENVANYLKLDFAGLTDDELAELAVILDAAKAFLLSYTGLEIDVINIHKEFVIAIYVLCQDMYDNRCFYVDKSNLNKVVQTILGMHSVNLL